MDAAADVVTAGNAQSPEPLPLPKSPSFTFSDDDDDDNDCDSHNGERTSPDNGAGLGGLGILPVSHDDSTMNAAAAEDDVDTAGNAGSFAASASSEPLPLSGENAAVPPSTTISMTFSQMLDQVAATNFPDIQLGKREDDGELDSLNGEHASPDDGAGPGTPSDAANTDDNSDNSDDSSIGYRILTSPSLPRPSPSPSPSPER